MVRTILSMLLLAIVTTFCSGQDAMAADLDFDKRSFSARLPPVGLRNRGYTQGELGMYLNRKQKEVKRQLETYACNWIDPASFFAKQRFVFDKYTFITFFFCRSSEKIRHTSKIWTSPTTKPSVRLR